MMTMMVVKTIPPWATHHTPSARSSKASLHIVQQHLTTKDGGSATKSTHQILTHVILRLISISGL
jgi:hypothetical protein